jgi:hypothetical protein
MNTQIYTNRTNSLSDYVKYLMDLAPTKFEQVTKGETTMYEYNQLTFTITDLLEILNNQNKCK